MLQKSSVIINANTGLNRQIHLWDGACSYRRLSFFTSHGESQSPHLNDQAVPLINVLYLVFRHLADVDMHNPLIARNEYEGQSFWITSS